MAHLVKLIQSRTLHLQRIVNSNPYTNTNEPQTSNTEVQTLTRRLEDFEARFSNATPLVPNSSTTPDTQITPKQSAMLTTEVRRTLQPELDALNRAVRRYEKRATLQTMQTESRLLDLEARLNDAISLAAAAANNSHHARNRNIMVVFVEWLAKGVVLPVQVVGTLVALPFRMMIAAVGVGRKAVGASERSQRSVGTEKGKRASSGGSSSGRTHQSHGRIGAERLQSTRVNKR